MKQLKSYEIRELWLQFFASKQHHIVESCSLIPVNDPSLLWINSGVATLKQYFDGRKTPPSNRLTNSQKSIRTNDIENVGFTARHHTLFEMLGNFSIGDYFKKEAIEFAWEFLTSPEWIGLDPSKLYVTIYNEDKEAYHIWHDLIGLEDNRIIQGGKDTNFWEIGEGPCGPNTEIFYDRGLKYDPEQVGLRLLKEDIENDRYLEIWNIVFSQFNHKADGTYEELPRKNIDTGAGLERITSVLQETPTNFETDLFMPIIKNIEVLINHKYTYDANVFFTDEPVQKRINSAFKIIADHIRAVTFAIADGAFPSNKDRGYVIRRLIRRASLYGQKLGLNEPFLYKLVDKVIEVMGDFYKYLSTKRAIVQQTVREEEEKFLKTLEQGYRLFNDYKDKYGLIDKHNAFKLFETYGFPIELIVEEAKNAGISVDEAGFAELLEFHKQLSRQSRKDIKAMYMQNALFTTLDVPSLFVGYETDETNATVNFMFANDEPIQTITDGECFIILDRTPFYAEKGGQASDNGFMTGENCDVTVLDVQQGPQKQHIHQVFVKGTLNLNQQVHAQVNKDKRFYTRKNHSGTHLIHAALREVLGNHVMQIGSYNDEERLRIDINHNEPISEAQLLAVEQSVEGAIRAQIPCEIIHASYQEAVEKHHALAFFTEKYDDVVRIVKFGTYSCELCGGTHCANSKEVEDLMITGVESKGANSFRIHAITSNKTVAEYLTDTMVSYQNQIAPSVEFYTTNKQHLVNRDLDSLIHQVQTMQPSKSNVRAMKKLVLEFNELFRHYQQQLTDLQEAAIIAQLPSPQVLLTIDTHPLYWQGLTAQPMSVLKKLVDNNQNHDPSGINIFLTCETQGAYKFVISGPKMSLLPANRIVKEVLSNIPDVIVKGGGNPQFAQGEIKTTMDYSTLQTAILSIIKEITKA